MTPDPPAGDDGDGDGDGGPRATPPPNPDADVVVREADPAEFVDVMRVLEGALLDVSADRVRAALDRGEAVVAVPSDAPDPAAAADADAPFLAGALVRDRDRVVAVAVRRSRRGRGIGTALLDAAARDAGRLTAAFDPSLRGFYESAGFDMRSRSRPPADADRADDGRLVGVRDADADADADSGGGDATHGAR